MNTIAFTTEDDSGAEITLELPAIWAICDGCGGNGVHDHPAFSNGISQEDFDEDPDFRESYFAGHYDVRCEECNGTGKVLVPLDEGLNAEQQAALDKYYEQKSSESQYRRECEAVRRAESGYAY